MTRFRFNPLTAEFDLVEKIENSTGVAQEFIVDASSNVGDVVKESLTIDGKAEVATDNTSINRAIGVIIEKLTLTTAVVKTLGEVDGFSGLTKGLEVFLSTGGSFTSTPPATGYVQIMGFATSATKVYLEPGNFRAKRTP